MPPTTTAAVPHAMSVILFAVAALRQLALAPLAGADPVRCANDVGAAVYLSAAVKSGEPAVSSHGDLCSREVFGHHPAVDEAERQLVFRALASQSAAAAAAVFEAFGCYWTRFAGDAAAAVVASAAATCRPISAVLQWPAALAAAPSPRSAAAAAAVFEACGYYWTRCAVDAAAAVGASAVATCRLLSAVLQWPAALAAAPSPWGEDPGMVVALANADTIGDSARLLDFTAKQARGDRPNM